MPPPKHRANTSADIYRREYIERQNRISERNKEKFKKFEQPYCQDFSDCLDGFVIHTSTCPRYQQMAISGTGCINLQYVGSNWPTGLAEVLNAPS